MSKSDPHLDIPHFLVSQDEAHPSLNKIMSNLQHVHEGLKTPVSSHPNLQALRRENEFQDKNVSLKSRQHPNLWSHLFKYYCICNQEGSDFPLAIFYRNPNQSTF
ncbi:hypothetical protein GCK72_024199 [Caenorhabditis remanei]|uniref:Uncharacterized protein n=1 Tax=Caenorhabditis remanei TaxID=31234 RepID=A0A6A5FYU7_CAERE|nr:hypothetical protein GCK72_024199 [Caenorhabditis remanei]KAF1747733.1 hypothetical protein GCK72_024199 [Caenorhabditis remanei]